MKYQESAQQYSNRQENYQTGPNILMNSSPTNKFMAVASAAGFDLATSKKLFKLWDERKYNTEYQEKKDIHNWNYDPTFKSSRFGLPIFDRYIELQVSNTRLPVEERPTITLDIVFIEHKRKPVMVITTVPGKEFTIKEKLSGGDYELTLKGSLISEYSHNTPTDEATLLNEILSTDNAINISSRYINSILKVSQVIVKDFTIKEDSKYSNMMNFEIKLLSDEEEGILI